MNGSHWLLEREQPRRRLDADTVVSQAHILVHEGGAASLTMRPLAAALGTSTSALYRLVPSKQWLLVAIVDLVFGEVETSTAADVGDPRGRLEQLSTAMHEVLVLHPHLHEILASHVWVTPNTIRIAEIAFTSLREMGLDDPELVDAYNAWSGYVIGFSAIEAKPAENAPDRALQRAMRRQLEEMDPGAFPILTELMPDVADRAFGLPSRPRRSGESGSSFAWGLAALLDGVAARKRRRSRA